MTHPQALAHRLAPWGFPIVYLGWAYLFWVPLALSGAFVWSAPAVFVLLIGGLSPLLAGLSLLWLTQGRAGYRDLRRRLTETGRIGAQWGLLVLLFYPIFTLLVGALAFVLGLSSSPLAPVRREQLFDPGALLFLIAVALVFPTVEEIGLRGYWFDQLQARFSALNASLILGVVWAAWHVPLFWMAGYYDETTFDPELWWFAPNLVLTAIVGTWIYNNTGRSILAVIGFHFFGNLTGELLGFSPELYPFSVVGIAVVAAVLIVGWSPESLRGWGTSRPASPSSRGR